MKTEFKLPEYIPVKYERLEESDDYFQIENQYEKAVIGLPETFTILDMYDPVLIVVNPDMFDAGSSGVFCIDETSFGGRCVGNVYITVKRKKLRCFVLFHFSEDKETLTVYYIPLHSKKNKKEGLWFTMDNIKCLLDLVAK